MTASDDPEQASKITAVIGSIAAAATTTATGRTRMNFSAQHLLVAARLAREVSATEKQNNGMPFGEFFDVVLGSSVGCIVLAIASAESYINEIFAERQHYFTAHDQSVLNLLWAEYEQKSVLDKYDLAHCLRSGTAMNRGETWVQSMDRLVKLRNGLTHFKPEWSDDQQAHLRLSGQLEHYAERSQWLSDESLFPRAWATSATTTWAITSVVQFIDQFSKATGIPDRLSKFAGRLATT